MMNVLKCLYKKSLIHADLGYIEGHEHGETRNILFDANDTKRFYVIDFGEMEEKGKNMTAEDFEYWTPEKQFEELLKLVKQKK